MICSIIFFDVIFVFKPYKCKYQSRRHIEFGEEWGRENYQNKNVPRIKALLEWIKFKLQLQQNWINLVSNYINESQNALLI